MVLNFTADKAFYTKQLRDLPTTISYTPVVKTEGAYGRDIPTEGDTQVYPARIDEMGLESEPVKIGILSPGDYVAAVSGDNVIPHGGIVIARGNRCKVVKTSQGNTATRRLLYLEVEA